MLFIRTIFDKRVQFEFLPTSGLAIPDTTCIRVTFLDREPGRYGNTFTLISTMTKMDALRIMAVMVNRLRSAVGIQLVGKAQTRLALRQPDQYGLWPASSWHWSHRQLPARLAA